MRYTVIWRETALQQLANIWIAAADRAAVNRAVDDVDAELADDPDQKGEDYFGARYILNAVLWALFHVFPDDPMVHLLQVGGPGTDLPHDAVS
jgi:hypothetical protein